MSFKSLIRSLPWTRIVLETVPVGHPFRRLEMQPFMMFVPYKWAVAIMDPFDWWCFYGVSGGLVVAALLIQVIAFVVFGFVIETAIALLPLMFFFFVFATAASMTYGVHRFLDNLHNHLNIDRLSQVVTLSPSELESLCLQRLQTLASELEGVESRTMPLAKERTEASANFRMAYWFFRNSGLIKQTDWSRFFEAAKG